MNFKLLRALLLDNENQGVVNYKAKGLSIGLDKGYIKDISQKAFFPFSDFIKEYLFSPLGITVEVNAFFRNKEEQLAWYKEKNVGGLVAD